jgi:hypothetical protein
MNSQASARSFGILGSYSSFALSWWKDTPKVDTTQPAGSDWGIVVLPGDQFEELETCVTQPPAPTKGALQGQAMLREWLAKKSG